MFRTAKVLKYVNDVAYLIRNQKIKPISADKLRIELLIYPPDLRKRDLDNICKAILDSLQHAGIFDDDFKIWQLTIERREVRKYGEVGFTITEIP